MRDAMDRTDEEFAAELRAAADIGFECPARCAACGLAVAFPAALVVEPVWCADCYRRDPVGCAEGRVCR